MDDKTKIIFPKRTRGGMEGKNHTYATRLKISISKRGRPNNNSGTFKKGHVMSQVTIEKIRATLISKREQQHNWKGGITPESFKIRGSKEYNAWRLAVYRKCKWKCHACGMKCQKKDIVAHHIMLFKDFPDERFNVKNGVVYHRKCHRELHASVDKFIKSIYGFNKRPRLKR